MSLVPFKNKEAVIVIAVGIDSVVQCAGSDSPGKNTIMHTGKINLVLAECKGSQVLHYQSQYYQSRHDAGKSPFGFRIYDDTFTQLISFESLEYATSKLEQLEQGLSIVITALVPLISKIINDSEKKLTEEVVTLHNKGIKNLSGQLRLDLSFRDDSIELVCDETAVIALRNYFNGLPAS